MYTVLVTDTYHAAGLEVLESASHVDLLYRPGLSPAELVAAIGGAHALIVRSSTRVTAEVIEAAHQLKLIARAGVGVDNIDVRAATRRGIVVANCPSGNTISAAEHTIGLIFSLARRIPQAHQSLREGAWKRSAFMGRELTGKTLGLVGLGRIGAEVARRAQGLGLTVVAFDPFVTDERARQLQIQRADLEEVLRQADILSVHAPLNDQTRGLIDGSKLRLMKRGAFVINCARGGIVDEAALAEAVEKELIGGAAVDVFESEPPPADHPLLHLDRVVVTPHLGAATAEAQEKVAVQTALAVVNGLATGNVPNALNQPVGDPALLRELRGEIRLVERLGTFAAQLVPGGLRSLSITYEGVLAERPTRILTTALLRAILSSFLGERVNFVNAPLLAEERGIVVTDVRRRHAGEFTGLVSLEAVGEGGARQLKGTLFGHREPRLVHLDGFDLEAPLAGPILVFSNRDRPGVIGRVGTVLGDRGVNIAGMHLGRRRAGGKAIALIALDQPIEPDLVERLAGLPEMLDVHLVTLPGPESSAAGGSPAN